MATFLIDENISPKTLQFLTELKFDVTTLKSRGITDKEVVAQAIEQKNQERTLLGHTLSPSMWRIKQLSAGVV
jgi:hypothetical protein